jgi:SAM-dependent methyltransferase
LLKERLKSILRGSRSPAGGGPPPPDPPRSRFLARAGPKQTSRTRLSRGLDQFFGYFRDQSGLALLDLGGTFQDNINFITSLGHKFYSEDFLRIHQETFGADPADQANPGRIEYFLRQSLNYPDQQFDGVLGWDVLEYLAPALLTATVDRLERILKPGGYMLAFFHSADRPGAVPCYSFRIQDCATLLVAEHGQRERNQLFNNRKLEKLFHNFASVKFFLTREHLREVIVRKSTIGEAHAG